MKTAIFLLAISAYAQVTFTGKTSISGNVGFGSTQTLLPLEIMSGANGVAADASPISFTIPTLADPTAATTLTLRIHNLRANTLSDTNGTGRVRVNGGSWVNIIDSNITLVGADMGGVGGALNTIRFTIPIAGSTLVQGVNTTQFGFRGTDGFASVFRVLEISIKDLGGTELIAAGTFGQENPALWTGPYTDPGNIAAGETLWETATLFFPFSGTNGVAHCNDCHAVGGRDLKYFNYSNASIENRSIFHGLTSNEGKQIASYIRSLSITYSPYARPWNPPYQPGPGVDARGVYHWAAGAGIDAVVDNDTAMAAVAPNNGASPDFDFSAKPMNIRQTPLTVPYPDWNLWLPRIHPVDSIGRATFEANAYYTKYLEMRAAWAPGTIAALNASAPINEAWDNARYIFCFTTYPPPATWTAANVAERYGYQLWMVVKLWELHQEFGMEALSQAYFGPNAEIWAHFTSRYFQASPRLMYIPPHSENSQVVGILNDKLSSYNIFGFAWYQFQIGMNSGNGEQFDNNPVDWPYQDGAVMGISASSAGGQRVPSMQLINYVQGFQTAYMNLSNVNAGYQGFPFMFVASEWWRGLWNLMNSTTRAQLFNRVLTKWLERFDDFTVPELWALGIGGATEVVSDGADTWGGKMWRAIPKFRHVGVDQAIIDALCDWSAPVWPYSVGGVNNWSALKTAPCTTIGSGGSSDISCTYP